MVKNTAGQTIGAQLVSATDGSAFTGSVTVSVTIDAGTQATGSVGSGACTHEGNGYHTYAPAQAETNGTLLAFTFTGTGAVPVTVQVFTTGYDPTVANLPANVTQFGGSNGTFASGRPEVNTTHVAGTSQTAGDIIGDTNDIQSRLPAALVSGRIDASVGAMASDVVTATALAASAVSEIQSGLSTLDAAGVRTAVGLASANLDTQIGTLATASALSTVAGYIDTEVAAIKAKTDNLPASPAATGDIPSAASIADAVWEEAIADHSGTAGSTAEQLAAAGAGGDPWATAVPGSYTSGQAGYVLGNVATGTPPTAAAIADAVWDEALSGHAGAGSAGAAVSDILTDTGTTLQGELDGIQADTEDIQSRLPAALVSGRIDASVGAMASDVLTSTALAASAVTEIQSGLSTLDAAGVRSAVGLASANLDTQIGTLATASNLATVAGYIDTEVAAIKSKTDQLTFTTANKIDARAFTVDDKTGYSIASGGIGSGAHAAAELNAIADAILDRNLATGTDSGTNSTTTRTVRQALRRLRNKEAISAGTGTVYKEDDSTSSWTYAATTAAGDPLSAVDPT